ncbi:MAG: hypothetical protein RBS80_28205 [Thermoguttaceae bacterium]|jgi:hypothetical protein|nr:hypothetical protein [Thermoguttaceae bacterium]
MIHAQATALAAEGYFLEAAAIARRHHALAAKQEMENMVQWVDTYFEMRQRNRAWRLKEGSLPNYMRQERERQEVMRYQVENFLENALKNDIAGKLNWLLTELSGLLLSYRYQAGFGKPVDLELDQELTPNDIRHLRLTDGGRLGGQKLVFRAHDAKVLQTDWPLAFRSQQFDEVREYFEATRDRVVESLGAGCELSTSDQEAIIDAVDQLRTVFNEVYDTEHRLQMQLEQPGTYSMVYKVGERFLQALAVGVFRAVSTNDRAIFDGSYRFDGTSVPELVEHMCGHGFEFAPPEAGDEPTYRKVYLGMRELYLRLRPEPGIPEYYRQ